MATLVHDVRYGFRMLAKYPGFTAVAVLTLALGIGANTAIFSVVNAVMLRPLPYPQPGRLVSVDSVLLGSTHGNASYPDFADWRSRNHVFDSMAAFRTDNYTLTGAGAPLHLRVIVGSAELWKVLKVKPFVGRAFLPGEDTPGSPNGTSAVILSYGLWQRRFGSDRHVLGRTIDLNDQPYTVVGVMPASFQFPPLQPESADLWTTMAPDLTPLASGTSMASQRGAHYLDVVARLRANVTVAQAQAEMSTIVSALNKQYPENKPRGVNVTPMLHELVEPVGTPLLVLLAAVGCVLLIACANVANLLLARATTRTREMAIRAALGASRVRVILQVLTESLLLAACGGSLGVLGAVWGIEFLRRLIPPDVPRIEGVTLDGRVLAFTVVLSLATGILFGLIPAFRSSKSALAESLKESGRGTSDGRRRNAARSLLVVGEIAMALCLLIGAGLLLRSFLRLETVDPGFDPHHVLTFNIVLPSRYSQAQRLSFFQRAVTRIATLPGVRASSAAVPLPLDGDTVDTSFNVEGQPKAPDNPDTDYSFVEPGYFRTLGIGLVRGRDFTWRDDLKSPPVVIINEELAKNFFPGQNPLGRHLNAHIGNGYPKSPMREIVGVARDVKNHGLDAAAGPEVYVPLGQSPLDVMTFVVRTGVDPGSMTAAVQGAIQQMDKDLPLFGVKTLDEYVGQSIAASRFVTLLVGIFGALALVLAMVGIYGVISYSVAERTHEIGIRMALGADRAEVLGLVVRQGMVLALAGIAGGIALALPATRALSSLLYGVGATDPVTFIGVSIALAGVAFAASYIPARRATKVDPMVALRYE